MTRPEELQDAMFHSAKISLNLKNINYILPFSFVTLYKVSQFYYKRNFNKPLRVFWAFRFKEAWR